MARWVEHGQRPTSTGVAFGHRLDEGAGGRQIQQWRSALNSVHVRQFSFQFISKYLCRIISMFLKLTWLEKQRKPFN